MSISFLMYASRRYGPLIGLLALLASGITGCSKSRTTPTPVSNAAATQATNARPIAPGAEAAINDGKNASKAGQDWVRQHAPRQ